MGGVFKAGSREVRWNHMYTPLGKSAVFTGVQARLAEQKFGLVWIGFL